MTIHPPKVVIDEKAPFKDALFGREEFGKSLTSLLCNVSDSLVIFVNAPWGTGKTTFARMWLSYLKEQEKLDVIYYDAYAADYFDDPFVSFSGEILELTKRITGEKALIEREEFKKSAVKVGKRLAGIVAKVGIRAATLGAVESTDIDQLKEIGTEIATGASEIGSNFIEKKIENYTEEKDALKDFKKKLTKLAAKFRENRKFPLTIVVDELDRCRPDFALNLLERIKHLFDVEGVSFVLLVNRDQIENYIQAVYGINVDARSYLLKFGNIFVDLPNHEPMSSFSYVAGRQDYCRNLVAHYGLSQRVQEPQHFINWAGVFANHFDLTLREIEKVFAVLAIYFASPPTRHDGDQLLVLLLSVLKIKRPSIYESLARERISAGQFYQESNIKQMERHGGDTAWAWLLDALDYCLMSEDEFKMAIAESPNPEKKRAKLKEIGDYLGPNRKKILPLLCWRLDRFSLQLQPG